MNRYERHQEICKLLTETYKKKNEDYGNSFGNTFEKLGLISAVTRIAGKSFGKSFSKIRKGSSC